MSIYVIDTETTSLDNPRCIELGWVKISFPDLEKLDSFEQRYFPEIHSSLGALATHNILYSELIGNPNYKTAKLPDDAEYIIGHNVDFDARVLGVIDSPIKRICTKALSSYLFPKLDSHRQSAMVYFFEGEDAKDKLLQAHSALPDAKNCLLLLSYLLKECFDLNILIKDSVTIEELYTLSEKARIPTRISFGKYKGELIKDIPAGYKSWLLKQPDLDPYLEKALLENYK